MKNPLTLPAGYYHGAAVVGWAGVVGLCYLKWQDRGLLGGLVVSLICIPPTVLSLLLAVWSRDASPAERLAATLGGMAFRVVVALGVGLAVFLLVPRFHQPGYEYGFWGPMLLVYLYTLGCETVLGTRFAEPNDLPADSAR